MDTVRDLARADPWRNSLERSLARRGIALRSSATGGSRRAQREAAGNDPSVRELPNYWLLGWRAVAKRWLMLVAGAAGLLTLALLAATRPSLSDGRSAMMFAKSAHAGFSRIAARTSSTTSTSAPPGAGAAGGSATQPCRPADRSAGYLNPLESAFVTPRRIDQGVDYAGSGMLTAIGDATVTYIATSDTGWPGAFIEYRLLGGPESGCYVFYAEGVTPAEGLHVGEAVRAGQAIATIIPDDPSGIEIGWGAGEGTESYAAKMGQWSAVAEEDNIPTPAGRSFSALIAALGGPPGRVGE